MNKFIKPFSPVKNNKELLELCEVLRLEANAYIQGEEKLLTSECFSRFVTDYLDLFQNDFNYKVHTICMKTDIPRTHLYMYKFVKDAPIKLFVRLDKINKMKKSLSYEIENLMRKVKKKK